MSMYAGIFGTEDHMIAFVTIKVGGRFLLPWQRLDHHTGAHRMNSQSDLLAMPHPNKAYQLSPLPG
jgi:hypothetical protein